MLKHLCVIFALLLSSCAPQHSACMTGKRAVQTQLFFGMQKQDGTVTPREWRDFVTHVIAPRFHEGFTVTDAQGYWLSEQQKKTISENSKLVLHLHSGAPDEDYKINTIIGAYKKMFRQEAVLRVDTQTCAAFGAKEQ